MKRSTNAGDAGEAAAGAHEAVEAETQPPESATPRRTLGVKPADASAEVAEGGRKQGVRARFLPGFGKARAQERPADKPAERQVKPRAPRAKTVERAARPADEVARPRKPAAAGRQDFVPRSAVVGAKDRGESARRPRREPEPAVRPAPGPSPEGVRLSKVMSERGLCSRREADEMIERGWVFVDGERVSELGTRINPDADIKLAAQARRHQSGQVTILLHKPVGYVSGQPEPGYEPAVSLIGAGNQFDRDYAQPFDFSHLKGLAPAGRLDIDSTGLLVMTQDGRIARQLIGDDSQVDKEYLVRVEGELDDRGLALLNHGLELDGRKLRHARVEWVNQDQLRFVLREGRKRQIRRMCELVGLKVIGLKRVRIGRVRLGDLPLGQWRFLREDEAF
jgi:23S rRNA pseudouridine2604 synthase